MGKQKMSDDESVSKDDKENYDDMFEHEEEDVNKLDW
jgi:hypothetical protein